LDDEGLYRIPGAKKCVREWRERIDQGKLLSVKNKVKK
jgi:hypothetical protein